MATLNLTRIPRLVKEGTWITLGQIAVVVGSLVLVRVLTEYLTPTQYGQLALGLTVSTLFGQVVFGGIGSGIDRFYAVAAEKQDLHGYLSATRRLLAYATSAALTIGALLLVGLATLGHSHWMGMAAAATILALLSGYNRTLTGIQNAARQRAIVALHRGLDAWLKILLAVGVLLWLGTSSTAVILGYAGSAFLVTLSQLVFLRRTIPPQGASDPIPNPAGWPGQIWQYSWPFSTWGIFTWMQQVSDRWSLGAFATTHDVGLYAVVFQLGYAPISIVLGMSMTFLAPILYQRSGDATSRARNDNVHHLIWRITATALIISGLGVLVTGTSHERLFSVLVAAEYREISYLFPWVVLAGGLFAAGQMLSLKLMSEMKSRVLLAPKVITALLGVGLNLAGAALAGVHGVVAALVTFSCLYLIWMIVLGRARRSAPQTLLGETG